VNEAVGAAVDRTDTHMPFLMALVAGSALAYNERLEGRGVSKAIPLMT
jgi:hypothetical protein